MPFSRLWGAMEAAQRPQGVEAAAAVSAPHTGGSGGGGSSGGGGGGGSQGECEENFLVFFYRCWRGRTGESYEDTVLECLHTSGGARGMTVGRALRASQATLLWSNAFQQNLAQVLPAGARTNHFPRSIELSHKHRLCRWMRRTIRGRRFAPLGFVLPDEAAEWAAANAAAIAASSSSVGQQQQQHHHHQQQQQQRQQQLWIVKPAQAGGGRHVRVVAAAAVAEEAARCAASVQLKRGAHAAVAQSYIARPLLVEGRKFDLRLYVLVTDFGSYSGGGMGDSGSTVKGRPARAYLFREGFVRFASELYSLVEPFSKFAHLTNNSVNRENVAGGEASLHNWSLAQLASWLQHSQGGGSGDSGGGSIFREHVWGSVRELVAEAVLSVSQPLDDALRQAKARQAAGRSNGGGKEKGEKCGAEGLRCFELFGFDVLLDDKLQPWLLEVNAQPSLGVGGALDAAIDCAMLQDLFRIVLGGGGSTEAAGGGAAAVEGSAAPPLHPPPTAADFGSLPHPAACVFEDLAVELCVAAASAAATEKPNDE